MKNKLKIIVIVLFLSSIAIHSSAQQKTRFPVWTFHDDSTIIHGLSVGLNSSFKVAHVKVNGINFELLGAGILAPLMPQSVVKADGSTIKSKFLSDSTSMQINGLNLSPLGNFCDCNINGLNVNGMASGANISNGLSIAFYANFANISNGVQCSLVGNDVAFSNGIQISFLANSSQVQSNGVQVSGFNDAYKHNGVQVGVINKAEQLKGIQLGLWNKNQKRSLPLINWVFKV